MFLAVCFLYCFQTTKYFVFFFWDCWYDLNCFNFPFKKDQWWLYLIYYKNLKANKKSICDMNNKTVSSVDRCLDLRRTSRCSRASSHFPRKRCAGRRKTRFFMIHIFFSISFRTMLFVSLLSIEWNLIL